MEEKKIQTQIDELSSKLDIILEEIELQRRHRREMDDLKDDLMRIGKDFYNTAVEELDQVRDHVDTREIFHLGKKLLRNVSTINKSIEQLESIKDFMVDASPLVRQSIFDLMQKLDEYDKKGYFEFVNEFTNVVDKVVVSFSKEDVKALGDNVVTMLNTVKNLTQPDMLEAINNAVGVYKNLNIHIEKEISLFSLMKELNTPEVKRGLAFAVQFLKNLANESNKNNSIQKSNIN